MQKWLLVSLICNRTPYIISPLLFRGAFPYPVVIKNLTISVILLYLDVGKFLYELIENSKYGDKITTKVADFMKTNYPEVKGFTKRNIERMVRFIKHIKMMRLRHHW